MQIGKSWTHRASLVTLLMCALEAWAGPCMVLGEKSAVVISAEGEKSPAFLTQSCEQLRLLSGKAMVSWVARDGKPHMSPVLPEGVTRYPPSGNESRSAKVAWAEVTTRREAPRAAVMRNMAPNETRPSVVYVPPEGLEIRPPMSAAPWRLSLGRADSTARRSIQPNAHGHFVLDKTLLPPGQDLVLAWSSADTQVHWSWRVLPETQTKALDEHYNSLTQTGLDEEQLTLLKAMWFEQLRLPLNLSLLIQGQP